MNNNVAIKVENLSKRYRIGQYVGSGAQYRTLRESLTNAVSAPLRRLKYISQSAIRNPQSPISTNITNQANKTNENRYHNLPSTRFMWALRDVSFEVKQGEVLGIIGRNGAGKSTLLKVLTRITEPTEGRAELHGRVGSLLEVGTGFHSELTGRENIYLSGAVLGMQRKEINRKFDEIVDFSGVETYIDTPVKRYSSGMRVRLGFAVAAHLEPEILLIDEVLAVGDAQFQKKCLGKMENVASEGRTVLFVSHNMEAILGLCPRAIWLGSGVKQADGPASQIVRQYLSSSVARGNSEASLAEITDRTGNGQLRFTGFQLRDEKGVPVDCAIAGDTVEFVLSYVTKGAGVRNVNVLFWILDDFGRCLLCFWSKLTEENFESLPPKGKLVCRVPRFPLTAGRYYLEIRAMINDSIKADHIQHGVTLEVVNGDFFSTGRSLDPVGPFLCEYSWRLDEGQTSGIEEV